MDLFHLEPADLSLGGTDCFLGVSKFLGGNEGVQGFGRRNYFYLQSKMSFQCRDMRSKCITYI